MLPANGENLPGRHEKFRLCRASRDSAFYCSGAVTLAPVQVQVHQTADQAPLSEGLNMKKLLGLLAFMLAFAPLAHAQDHDAGPFGHPDARNDRQVQPHERDIDHHRLVVRHARHAKHEVDHRRPRAGDHKK